MNSNINSYLLEVGKRECLNSLKKKHNGDLHADVQRSFLTKFYGFINYFPLAHQPRGVTIDLKP
jgi:hypothetical protein